MKIFGAFIALVNCVILFRQLIRIQKNDWPRWVRSAGTISLGVIILMMLWFAGSLLLV
jgi:hypothetical protein